MSNEKTYTNLNAVPVLAEVNRLIAEYEAKKEEIDRQYRPRSRWDKKPRVSGYPVDDVYKALSIFDWWVNTISYSHLRQMRTFLKEAIKLGFAGFVCFKVGASGCANGMWAHKTESTNGFSPEGDFLYRSFTPDYTCWDFCKDGNFAVSAEKWNSIKTINQLERKFFGWED